MVQTSLPPSYHGPNHKARPDHLVKRCGDERSDHIEFWLVIDVLQLVLKQQAHHILVLDKIWEV